MCSPIQLDYEVLKGKGLLSLSSVDIGFDFSLFPGGSVVQRRVLNLVSEELDLNLTCPPGDTGHILYWLWVSFEKGRGLD